VFSAIAGLVGFSALSGLLVTVMVAPALAVTGITASSTIGIFDGLPEYITIDQQPERNTLWAASNAEGNIDGYLPIATIYDQNRQEVPYDEISKYVLDAAVDGEDSRFFEHGGVDVSSVVRAALANVVSGGIEGGASTLSMQVVKNIYVQEALEQPTEEERDAAYEKATATSFDRKLKEMKLAIGLEKRYTKKEILTAYLNISNFGNATYGIQAAAQRYFSVNAADLTLAQAASLVAIVQYPNQRNLGDPENYSANQERRDYILDAMLTAGHITEKEHDEAIATPVDDTTLKPSPPANGCIAAFVYARWFCDYVVRSVPDFEFLGATEAERKANWKQGGYNIYTTLDLDVQIPAQDATWTYAPNTETGFELGSATSTVEAGTGRVLVMTENKLFDDSLEGIGPTGTAVNYNTSVGYGSSTGFQPGSTYKVFTLIDWLMHGKGVNERVNGDARTEPANKFKECGEVSGGAPFKFANASGERGIYTVRDGTVNSINGVFVSMAMQLDLCDIRDVAKSLGVERADGAELQTNPSSIIGTNEVTPLSMASAYAGIAAGGVWCKPIIVDHAVDPSGKDIGGQQKDCRQAIPANVAYTVIDVLKGVMNVSNTAYSNPEDGVPIFGKTGTTDFSNQTWMASGTSKAATAVWVGNIVGKFDITTTSQAGVRGVLLRHYITRTTMAALNAKFGGSDFPAPDPALLTGSGQEVPDLRGQSMEQAKSVLESLGFTFADGGPVDSDVEAGRVAATDPGAGTQSAKGAIVTVYSSKGNKAPFPDVVGDGTAFKFNEAKSLLNSKGYPNVSETCFVLAPESGPGPVLPGDPRVDRVQASDPAPGALTVPGAPVTLAIGKVTCP
jgi:membrane peptidoglycan carboxypeptidase